MEALINGEPGPHECWQELAEHSLTHDNLPTEGAHDHEYANNLPDDL